MATARRVRGLVILALVLGLCAWLGHSHETAVPHIKCIICSAGAGLALPVAFVLVLQCMVTGARAERRSRSAALFLLPGAPCGLRAPPVIF